MQRRELVVGMMAMAMAMAMAGCGGKKKSGGGGAAWPLARQEIKLNFGNGDAVIKGNLPSGWEQSEQMGGLRLAMKPDQDGMINGSLHVGPAMSTKPPKEMAEGPLDPSYREVDPVKEIAPGRWSRAYTVMQLGPKEVRFHAGVFWQVGSWTFECAGEGSGAPDESARWQQMLEVCKGVEIILP